LAVLLIGLFVFSWRTAVTAIMVVPLAVATAVVVLDLFGVPMNLLVVLGLVGALLLVIDGAVHDTRSILRAGQPQRTARERAPWCAPRSPCAPPRSTPRSSLRSL
jgi:Cu/Ag efflux pump CusA